MNFVRIWETRGCWCTFSNKQPHYREDGGSSMTCTSLCLAPQELKYWTVLSGAYFQPGKWSEYEEVGRSGLLFAWEEERQMA